MAHKRRIYITYTFNELEIKVIPDDKNHPGASCYQCCFQNCCIEGRADIPLKFEAENKIKWCCKKVNPHHYESTKSINP